MSKSYKRNSSSSSRNSLVPNRWNLINKSNCTSFELSLFIIEIDIMISFSQTFCNNCKYLLIFRNRRFGFFVKNVTCPEPLES